MSGLFSTPKMPEIKEQTPLPDEDDEAIAQARRRELMRTRQRQGAESTRLTPRTAQTGREFSRTLLG